MPSDESAIDIFPQTDGIEMIQRTTIFSKLDFEETRRLASIMRIERHPRGAVVIEQHSLGQALYIVRNGEVSVYRRTPGGERELLDRLGVGEIFGEMSLIDDLLVSADVEVSSDVAEVVMVPRPELEALLRTDDRFHLKIYRGFCQTLTDRLRNLSDRYVERIRAARRAD